MSYRWKASQQMSGYVPGEPDAYRQDNGDAIYAAGLMQGYRPAPAYGAPAFDPSTASTEDIISMQNRLGVVADGLWGKKSQAAYDAAFGNNAFNPATASKADIIAMQKRLGVSADGIWGKKSQSAYDAAFGKQEPYTNFGRRFGGDAGASVIDRSEQILSQIQEVQAELDKVNAEIEAFDRANPGLKGMTNEQREIAAQRASIGDMSAYDNMVQRGATGTQAVNTIENALMDAEKLTWGLSAQNTQDQLAARNQIEVAMRKAERDASQAGLDVTKIPSYQRLQAALASADSSQMNNNALVNLYKWKMENGTFTEDDRRYLNEVVKKDMNDKDFDKLFGFLKDSKGKTVEAKARREAKKKTAQEAAAAWDKNRDVAVKQNEWNKLVQAKAPITVYYELNKAGNPVPKGGVK